MKVKYEERKNEGKTIDSLEWGDTFILASEADEEEPEVFILIEPDYGLRRDDEEEYAIDVEIGELHKFYPTTKVIEVHSEISVRKP